MNADSHEEEEEEAGNAEEEKKAENGERREGGGMERTQLASSCFYSDALAPPATPKPGMRAPRMRTLSLVSSGRYSSRRAERAGVTLRQCLLQRCSSGTALGTARLRSRNVEIYDNA